ncbi:MAG: DNA adenine methylase [Bacteroidetes bacterium]|nr:DNA adenine methylase [Bacteroidota bacterium]
MKTPITYYGGKQTLVKRLLALIPQHVLYCEPFFGGGALFFAKPPSNVEVINDTNGEVMIFFKVVQTKFKELEKEIKSTLHSRMLWKKARVIYENSEMFSDVKRAWAFWTLANQGFAGLLTSWSFGKDDSKEDSVAKKRDDFSKIYADRLKKVQIECNDAIRVIKLRDFNKAFFYCDPPYINTHQGHYKGYMEADYIRLLNALTKIKGKFLLSSYPNAILKKYIKKYKWNVYSVTKKIAVTKLTDKIKTEVMVFNYDEKDTGIYELDRKMLKDLQSQLKKLKIVKR